MKTLIVLAILAMSSLASGQITDFPYVDIDDPPPFIEIDKTNPWVTIDPPPEPFPVMPLIPSFFDVGIDHFAFQQIEDLFASGITGGCGSGNFCPDMPVTRAQLAVMLMELRRQIIEEMGR